jgi:hypothetical protein
MRTTPGVFLGRKANNDCLIQLDAIFISAVFSGL